MTTSEEKLVWMDLEMTGLAVTDHRIVEIACIITDLNLNEVDALPGIAIHQSDEYLQRMDETVTLMHTSSGLVEAIKNSTIDEATAELMNLEFIRKYVTAESSPLCGNSIHTDRAFLNAYMPRLAGYLHYRNIDVSTLKELYRRWKPQEQPFEKAKSHRALDDIRQSIEELKFYREHFIR